MPVGNVATTVHTTSPLLLSTPRSTLPLALSALMKHGSPLVGLPKATYFWPEQTTVWPSPVAAFDDVPNPTSQDDPSLEIWVMLSLRSVVNGRLPIPSTASCATENCKLMMVW